MSRFDGNFGSAPASPLSDDEAAELLRPCEHSLADRTAAIARYLSGDEGWPDARKLLEGAFAEGHGRNG